MYKVGDKVVIVSGDDYCGKGEVKRVRHANDGDELIEVDTRLFGDKIPSCAYFEPNGTLFGIGDGEIKMIHVETYINKRKNRMRSLADEIAAIARELCELQGGE